MTSRLSVACGAAPKPAKRTTRPPGATAPTQVDDEVHGSDRENHRLAAVRGLGQLRAIRHLGGSELPRERAPLGVRLDHGDVRAGGGRDGRHLQAHLAGAHDAHARPASDARLIAHRVDAVGERLHERGTHGIEIAGNRQRAVRPRAGLDRQHCVLGVPGVRVAADALPDAPLRRVGPDLHDLADPLVAGIQRVAVARPDRVLAHVRRADAAGLDAHLELARARAGNLERLDAQIADAVQAGRAHRVAQRVVRFMAASSRTGSAYVT